MPDFLIRDIDADTAERIKAFAHARGCSLNAAMLHLLRQALLDAGGAEAVEPAAEHLSEDEARAFKEAMSALQGLPDDNPY